MRVPAILVRCGILLIYSAGTFEEYISDHVGLKEFKADRGDRKKAFLLLI